MAGQKKNGWPGKPGGGPGNSRLNSTSLQKGQGQRPLALENTMSPVSDLNTDRAMTCYVGSQWVRMRERFHEKRSENRVRLIWCWRRGR